MGSVNETEVEKTIKAAVTAKSKNVQVSAGISFGSGSSSKVTAERVAQLTTFTARGGDTTLATNPQNWPDSVKDPNKWAVIRVSKLAPITDWLEPTLRARAERLLPAIQVPKDVPAENHFARVDSDGFIFGMRICRSKALSSQTPVFQYFRPTEPWNSAIKMCATRKTDRGMFQAHATLEKRNKFVRSYASLKLK